jgi:Tfp pilus assembly protein PilF
MDEQEEQIQEWLYDGVLALLQGDKEAAQELLMQVVEIDERHEQAWLWLSGAVDDIEDRQVALENVLDINPDNEYARLGMRWIMAQR